jgi:hypothetical protein
MLIDISPLEYVLDAHADVVRHAAQVVLHLVHAGHVLGSDAISP